MAEPTTRVLLVDDHAVVRLGLRFVLEENLGFQVLECGEGKQAAALALSGEFDLVILDVHLGEPDGLWVLDRIREGSTELPVLMISTFAAPDQVQASIDRGVNGYVMKEASPAQLQEAVEIALGRRGLYLHPTAAEAVRRRPVQVNAGQLSDRELEVVRLVAVGRTNAQIGAALFCSEKTVKARLTSVLRKLSLTNRTQAAAWALREGIIDTRSPVAV
jgi:DNA-binding NarL/FixJ family response regulator